MVVLDLCKTARGVSTAIDRVAYAQSDVEHLDKPGEEEGLLNIRQQALLRL